MWDEKGMREQFCRKLDSQDIEPCDLIVVLRNHDPALNKERVDYGIKLLLSNMAPILLMTYDSNTLTEAQRIFNICKGRPWSKMVLVTHKSHHYRAYLTFAKVFKSWFPDYKIYTFPVVDNVSVYDEFEEFDKIERYSKKGDIATYEEGIAWL